MHVAATFTRILNLLEEEDKHPIDKYITENPARSISGREWNNLVRILNLLEEEDKHPIDKYITENPARSIGVREWNNLVRSIKRTQHELPY
ncbi:hypothetical protein T265_11909 [Opisthorchis viverrini]|uniref:Uncharacterized protein n=1 Tax=Opisthorchis viverrini TaxID=6198 RepID=A0A074ZVR1_OPIVI|nr:hypothetical protein T265_11909 [Opisthorchis viverrini]KER19254.1 hypothetical protein T265_11909 [Opisthorchis viverrini]